MRDCAKKEKQKFISIVIPVYNAQKTLEKCLDSILQQSFVDYECILVNDGSKDCSLEIIESYAKRDDRVQVINQENQGVSTARNEGLKKAIGEYVLFIDSDDFIPAHYLACMVGKLHEYEESVFVWTSIDITTSDGEKVQCCNIPSDVSQPLYRKDVCKLSRYGLLNSPYCKLYKREWLMKYDICFPKDLSIAEDLLFNLSYLDIIGELPIFILTDVSYQYVRYEGSLDNRYIPKYWEIHKEILETLKKKSVEWNTPKQDMQLFYERYWDYVQHALYNTMLERNPMKLQEKLQVNNQILQEEEVQSCITAVKGNIRKSEFVFYKYLNYTCYYYLKKLLGKG